MKILVTGATGQLGSKVVEHLLKEIPAEQLAVSVRNADKAKHLSDLGVDVRQADFDQPETLKNAFAGIGRLLLISTDGDTETRIRQHSNAVTAAKDAKVGLIAYTSVSKADTSGLVLAEVHKATEEKILESGLPYIFLRNNWYLENELDSIKGALAGQPIVVATGDAKVGWILRDDLAKAAAAAMLGKGEDNHIYELSNKPETIDTFAATLAKIIGKDVEVKKLSDETYGEMLAQAGLPQEVIPFVVSIQNGIRHNNLNVESNDFETLTGQKPVSLEEGLRQIVASLS